MVLSGGGDRRSGARGLLEAQTGIAGLDEVIDGGLPQARTTLLCGGPACGKTLMPLQFLITSNGIEIKQLPPPVRQLVGDTSDRDRVLLVLDLRSIDG